MALDFEPLLKWVWAPFIALGGGSIEFRLRNKVSKDVCDAIHTDLLARMDGIKESINKRFDDHERFYSKQIDRVIREVKKNNNGGS